MCLCRYTVFENGTLKVTHAQLNDTGSYSCEVITDLDHVEAVGSVTVVGVSLFVWGRVAVTLTDTNSFLSASQQNQKLPRLCFYLKSGTTAWLSAGHLETLTTAPSQVMNTRWWSLFSSFLLRHILPFCQSSLWRLWRSSRLRRAGGGGRSGRRCQGTSPTYSWPCTPSVTTVFGSLLSMNWAEVAQAFHQNTTAHRQLVSSRVLWSDSIPGLNTS